MTVETNRKKAAIIFLKIRNFLQKPSPTISKLALIVESVISIFPAIPLRKLHHRALEKEKISLLKEKCENYEPKILSLNKHVIEDLKRWLGVIPLQVDSEINTDVIETGDYLGTLV